MASTRPALLRGIPALVLAAAAAGGGCRAAREFAAPGLPAAYRSGEPSPSPSYGAWRKHTEGQIGEDLFPAPLPGSGGLVFSSNRHSARYKLYLAEPDQKALRRLTDGPGDDIHPAADSGGTRVAFASNREGGWRLYLLENLEGGPARRLSRDDAPSLAPSWSPNGSEIAYSRRSPTSGHWEVWVLALDTGEERFITDGLFPEFHPRGGELVFQRPRRRGRGWYSIWTVRLDGTRERELVAGADWGAANPHWSPDGACIVFNTVGKGAASEAHLPPPAGGDLYLVRPSGTGLTRLTFRPTAEWNPAWGADGRIYFCATREHETAIWSLLPRR